MPPHLEKILSHLKQVLSSLYGDRLVGVVLFGSQASGNALEESDIDLAAILKGPVNPLEEIKRANPLLTDLSLAYDKDITCLFLTEERFQTEDTPLLRNIRQQGFSL